MSDSVTTYGSGTLGELPGNVRIYTAEETDSVVETAVSASVDGLSGEITSRLDELSGTIADMSGSAVAEDTLNQLIKIGEDPSCGSRNALLLASGGPECGFGYETPSVIKARIYDDDNNVIWDTVLTDSMFEVNGTSGRSGILSAMSGIADVQYAISDAYGSYGGATILSGIRNATLAGLLATNIGISGRGDTDATDSTTVGGALKRILDYFVGDEQHAETAWDSLSKLAQGLYVPHSVTADEVTDIISGYLEDNLCRLVSGCLSGYTASLDALTNAVSGLNDQVGVLQSGIENMVSGLADTIVQSLTTAEEEADSPEEQQRVAAAKAAFADPVKRDETIDAAKKSVGNSINEDITPAVDNVADKLDAPNTDEDVAGAASNVDDGGPTAVEAQDTSDNITKPNGVSDGLDQLATELIGEI